MLTPNRLLLISIVLVSIVCLGAHAANIKSDLELRPQGDRQYGGDVLVGGWIAKNLIKIPKWAKLKIGIEKCENDSCFPGDSNYRSVNIRYNFHSTDENLGVVHVIVDCPGVEFYTDKIGGVHRAAYMNLNDYDFVIRKFYPIPGFVLTEKSKVHMSGTCTQ
jgi:hypothetical protein